MNDGKGKTQYNRNENIVNRNIWETVEPSTAAIANFVLTIFRPTMVHLFSFELGLIG